MGLPYTRLPIRTARLTDTWRVRRSSDGIRQSMRPAYHTKLTPVGVVTPWNTTAVSSAKVMLVPPGPLFSVASAAKRAPVHGLDGIPLTHSPRGEDADRAATNQALNPSAKPGEVQDALAQSRQLGHRVDDA